MQPFPKPYKKSMKVTRELALDGGRITYLVTFKDMKNLRMKVKDNGTIAVSAPYGVSIEDVDDFVISHKDFIERGLRKTDSHHDILLQKEPIQSGDSAYFLGNLYTIKLHHVAHYNQEEVVIMGDEMLIFVREKSSSAHVKKVLSDWYREKAYSIIRQYAKKAHQSFLEEQPRFPEISMRTMTSRWGSCQPARGRLTFNTRLIQLERFCVEYVVWHEFTHFAHGNHGKGFYQRLSYHYPMYKEAERKLKEW
ncbi:MAG: M48 family metallopeptidase [Lachnospiraceae bacterium]|nr:M48 family metallopeptidase [Lachnospiraceae bacterium]